MGVMTTPVRNRPILGPEDPFDAPQPPADFRSLVRRELREAYERACESAGRAPTARYAPTTETRSSGTCRRCGIGKNDKTPGCKTCYMRHYQRNQCRR